MWDAWHEFLFFRHEYISGYYRVSSYFFGKLLSDLLPMRMLPSIIFTCITYFLLGKQYAKKFVSVVLDVRGSNFLGKHVFGSQNYKPNHEIRKHLSIVHTLK